MLLENSQQQTTTQESSHQTIYLVQHMEPYLFQWCLSQYLAMKQYLINTPSQLWITNAKSFLDYQGPQQESNKKYVQMLIQQFSKQPTRFHLKKQSLQKLQIQLQGSVCMLDLRAQQKLSVGQKWNYVVFGGILGDHPPRDRPQPLRKHFKQIRHLGKLQLATDTAVLVSRLILHNKVDLQNIPMIEEPTLKGLNKNGQKTTVQMEGFSYISKQIDIQTGKIRQGLTKKEKKQVYMSEGVRNLLLSQDLSAQLLM